MNGQQIRSVVCVGLFGVLLGLGLGLRGVQGAGPVGTDFTYQGELKDGGVIVDGVYDFEFKVFDAAVAGIQKGGTVNEEDVTVAAGRFTVKLDFGGGVFDGQERWLELDVRAGAVTDPNLNVSRQIRDEIIEWRDLRDSGGGSGGK